MKSCCINLLMQTPFIYAFPALLFPVPIPPLLKVLQRAFFLVLLSSIARWVLNRPLSSRPGLLEHWSGVSKHSVLPINVEHGFIWAHHHRPASNTFLPTKTPVLQGNAAPWRTSKSNGCGKDKQKSWSCWLICSKIMAILDTRDRFYAIPVFPKYFN